MYRWKVLCIGLLIPILIGLQFDLIHSMPPEVKASDSVVDSVDEQQYYLWGAPPTHGQPIGNGYDVGLMNKTRPTSWQRRNCSIWIQWFFDEPGSYSGIHTLTSLYYHIWFSSFEMNEWQLVYDKTGTYGGTPDGGKNLTNSYQGIFYTNGSQATRVHSDYRLYVGTLSMSGSVVGNAIYNFTIWGIGKERRLAPQTYPESVSPPNDPSFIIVNPPSNETLQSKDTDSDGLNDFEELFTYFTDPKAADTFGLGWQDSGRPFASYDYPWHEFQAFFNDSKRSKELDFSGTQDRLAYVRLSKYHYVQRATLSIAAFPKPLKYLMGGSDAGNRGLAIGDINNDGENELLIGDMGGNVRIWDTNSWKIIFSYDTGTQASSIEIGDFLSDAGNEFVLTSAEGNLYVFNSTLHLKWTQDVGTDCFAVRIYDVDNDGQKEMTVTSGTIRVYNSNFEIEKEIVTTSQHYRWGLDTGDANNDGLPDITAASEYNRVSVYNSSGTYQLITSFQALDYVFGWPRIHVSDIDNDGKNEIVVAGANGVTVFRLEETTLTILWNSPYIGAQPQTIYPKMGSTVSDLDGDGKKEIIVSGFGPYYNGTIYIINSLGKILYRFNSPRQACGIAVGDVDNNGDDDIVFGWDSTNTVTIYDGLPKDVAIDVGNEGSSEFSFSGLYTYNITADIKDALNTRLAAATEYWVNVPFKVTSTEGTLGLTVNVEYTSFGSEDLDDLNDYYRIANFPCVLNLTNGGITNLSYSSGRTSLTIKRASGTTSTIKMHSGEQGKPISVVGAASWSYDTTTKILTATMTSSCADYVIVHWIVQGDVNQEGSVNVNDLISLSQAYGSAPTSRLWNPNTDFNRDNRIDIFDLWRLGKNFGVQSLAVAEDSSKFTVENDYFIAKIYKNNGGMREFYIKPQSTVNIVNPFWSLGGHEMEWWNGTIFHASSQWGIIDSVSVQKVYESELMVTIKSALAWTSINQARLRITEYDTFYANKPYYLVSVTRYFDEEMPESINGDMCFVLSASKFWANNASGYIIGKSGLPEVFGYGKYRWLYESKGYGSLPWAWVYNATMNVGFGVILLDAYPHPQDVYLGERAYSSTYGYHEFQIRDYGMGGARRKGDYQTVSYLGVVDDSIGYNYIQTLAKSLYLPDSETVPRISTPLMINYGKSPALVGRTMMPKFRGDSPYAVNNDKILIPTQQSWDNSAVSQIFQLRYQNETGVYDLWYWPSVVVSDYYWNGSYIRLEWTRTYENKFNASVQFQFWNNSDTFTVDWKLKTLSASSVTSLYLLWSSGTTSARFKPTLDNSFTKLNVSSVFNPHMQDEGYMIRNMTGNPRTLSNYMSYWYWLRNPTNPVAPGQTFIISHQIQYFRRYDYENLGYFGISDFHAPSEGQSDLERLNKHYWAPLPLFEAQKDNLRILGIAQKQFQLAHLTFDGDTLTLVVLGDSGITSTTKIYCGDKGEPVKVDGASSWNYDAPTNILTITVTHTSNVQEASVYWLLSSDINRDELVNIYDLFLFARAFGSKPGGNKWNQNCDLNRDSIINAIDLSILRKNYGKPT